MRILEIIVKVKDLIKYIALLIVLVTTVTLSSAQVKLDSLQKELSKAESDSIRIVILHRLTKEYRFVNFNKADDFANQALKLSEEKKWNWAKAESYKQMSNLASLQGNYTTALK